MTRRDSAAGSPCRILLLLAAWLPLMVCCAAPEAPSLLRVAVHSDPLSLDPHYFGEHNTVSILGNLYEGLVGFDPELRIRPALAENWENPTELTWVFHLRSGVTFHDGRELTADDVVFSLNRVRFHPDSSLTNYLVAVQEVRAVDPATVEITTDRPFALLLNKLCFIMIVPRGSPQEILEPVGTGPYRLERREADRLVLRAHPEYWTDRAAIEELHFLTFAESVERAGRLLEGEVELAVIDPSEADRVEASGTARLLSREGLVVEYLQGRVDRPPFDDRRVRHAVSLALDREALVREAMGGFGEPANQLVSRTIFGHSPELPPILQDIAESRRLLGEAGYPEGFEVVLETREDRPGYQEIAEQLAAVGIRVEVRTSPWSELFPRLSAGEVNFYFGGVLTFTGDAADVLDSKLHSKQPDEGYGQTNQIGYSNPEVDRLIEQAASVLDHYERRQVLEQCMALLMEDLPVIPLFALHETYGLHTGYEWSPRLDGRVVGYEVRPAG